MENTNGFWEFSCNFYCQPRVKDSLLWLQDNRDLDVITLLLCLWQGRRHYLIPAEEMAQACQICGQWSSHVIAPIRASRRWIKTQGDADLYEQIKTVELSVEKSLIMALAGKWQDTADQRNNGSSSPDCAEKNTGLYLQQAGIEMDRDMEDQLAILIGSV